MWDSTRVFKANFKNFKKDGKDALCQIKMETSQYFK